MDNSVTGRRSILVVDDEPAVTRSMSRALTLDGYDVTEAQSGDEALEHLKRQDFDLLTLDQDMPGMTGVETLESVRKLERGGDLPTILVTSLARQELILEAIRIGINDFIKKPFELDLLRSKVMRWVNCAVDSHTTHLTARQMETLEITIGGLRGAFDALARGWRLPYEQITEVAFHVIEAVENRSIAGILANLQNHDSSVYAHSVRMAAYLTQFAIEHLSLTHAERVEYTIGGLLHDIGKAKLPVDLLHKRGPVKESEIILLRTHVDYSIEELAKVTGLSQVVTDIAAMHHERMDGTGYPRRLQGDQISVAGKMAMIVEDFVSMTDHNGYHEPLRPRQALGLIDSMDNAFDVALLSAFVGMVSSHGLEPL